MIITAEHIPIILTIITTAGGGIAWFVARLTTKRQLDSEIVSVAMTLIEPLEERVKALQLRIDGLEQENIALVKNELELKKRIATLETENEILRNRIRAVEAENVEMKKEVLLLQAENTELRILAEKPRRTVKKNE